MKKLSIAALALGITACSSDPGNVAINTYGEDYIEMQIPAEDIEDGWSVTYTKFLIVLSQIEIGDVEGNVGAADAQPRVFDMTRAGPHAVATLANLEAKRWDDVKISAQPASGAIAGNAAAADVTRMNQGALSVYVEGQGAKDGVTKTFKWPFTTTTHLADCQDDTAALGVVIPSGGTADIQFTIHGDHLFYDGLQNPDAVPRFAAIARADSNADGETTLEELAAVDLTDPTSPASMYENAGAGAVNNLRQFVEALSRTLVHFQGEGECDIVN